MFRHANVYVCVLCASCGSRQCCVLHDMPFVNAGREWNGRAYRRGILQSQSYDYIIGTINVSFSGRVITANVFIICRGLCMYIEMM